MPFLWCYFQFGVAIIKEAHDLHPIHGMKIKNTQAGPAQLGLYPTDPVPGLGLLVCACLTDRICNETTGPVTGSSTSRKGCPLICVFNCCSIKSLYLVTSESLCCLPTLAHELAEHNAMDVTWTHKLKFFIS